MRVIDYFNMVIEEYNKVESKADLSSLGSVMLLTQQGVLKQHAEMMKSAYIRSVLKGETELARGILFLNNHVDLEEGKDASSENPFAYQFMTPYWDIDGLEIDKHPLTEQQKNNLCQMLLHLLFQWSYSETRMTTIGIDLFYLQYIRIQEVKKPLFRTKLNIECYLKNGDVGIDYYADIEYIPEHLDLEYRQHIAESVLYERVKELYNGELSELKVPSISIDAFLQFYRNEHWKGVFAGVVRLDVGEKEPFVALVVVNNTDASAFHYPYERLITEVKQYIKSIYGREYPDNHSFYLDFSDCPALQNRPIEANALHVKPLEQEIRTTYKYDLKEDKIPVIMALFAGCLITH